MTGEVRVPPASGVQVDQSSAVAETAAGEEQSSEEVEKLRAQLDERTADLQRVSAEYSNYRRRVERDRQAAAMLAKSQVAGELLTVLDDIQRAEEHGDLTGAFKAVADKLVAALQTQGLQSFGAVGDPFDPTVHEAVQHSTSPDVQGPTVTALLRSGYRFGDRVLRPAMVAVTDAEPGPPAATPADAPEEAPGGDGAGSTEPEEGTSGDAGAAPTGNGTTGAEVGEPSSARGTGRVRKH